MYTGLFTCVCCDIACLDCSCCSFCCFKVSFLCFSFRSRSSLRILILRDLATARDTLESAALSKKDQYKLIICRMLSIRELTNTRNVPLIWEDNLATKFCRGAVKVNVKAAYIRRKYFFKFLIYRKILSRQACTMANNMVSSGLWENVMLTKINLPLDAPLVVQRPTWYQAVRHQIGDVAGSNTYKLLMLYTQCVGPPSLPCGMELWAFVVGLIEMGGRVYLRWRSRDFEQDLIPYVGQLLHTNVIVEGWIIGPYEHGLLKGPSNGM